MNDNTTKDVVLFDRSENIGIITLNRPEVLNAIDFAVGNRIIEILSEIHRSQWTRALVITGAGRAFSSGGDITAMKQAVIDGRPALFMHQLIHMLNLIVTDLREIKLPVVAAIPGITSGGGLDLALACDFRIASEQAKFKAAYTGIGLVPAGGGSHLLPSIIGPAKALEFFLMNDIVVAADALRIGLINAMVPHNKLLHYSLDLAKKLASGATMAYGYTKFLLNEFIGGSTLEQHLAKEATLQAEIMVQSTDFKEGIRSFLEHRKPNFKGK
jgi:2-(1,2-epoxy-1,2-dihydrophenyl)acetyl-CoA isomerase